MSNALKAGLSTLVGISAVVAVLALASGIADVAGAVIVTVAIVVFMRAVLRLASESGEQPHSSPSHPSAAGSGVHVAPDLKEEHPWRQRS
jgi:hypothetical protein